MAKAKKAAIVTLAIIVAAGANGMQVLPDVFGPLEAEGLVEVNRSAAADAQGALPTRATEAGIAKVAADKVASTPVAKPQFVIEDGIEIPQGAARGRQGNMYPFDLLGVNQSFFVANTAEKPDVAKSLASTVSSATARYAVEEVPQRLVTNRKGKQVPAVVEHRKFVVRSVEGGARIWRTL